MAGIPTPHGQPSHGRSADGRSSGTDAPDLSTTYMGLSLRSPIVASSGPLTGRVESLAALEAAGVGAVVLPSLFEEQVTHEDLQVHHLMELGVDTNPEATSYFPDIGDYTSHGERYLQHVRDARATVSVPVIGSLNGVTPGGWVRHAQHIADVGADALELNLYTVVAAPQVDAAAVESSQLALVEQVASSVTIPVAVKIGPYYTAFADMARRLAAAGADALVLFNRFYQPGIDIETRDVAPRLDLSHPSEVRLPLRWTALLSGRVEASLAVTGGVHGVEEVAAALLAGADVAMMTSALLRRGPGHVATVEQDLRAWLSEQEYVSVAQCRGSASHRHVADPTAYERANYIDALVRYSANFEALRNSSTGAGPW